MFQSLADKLEAYKSKFAAYKAKLSKKNSGEEDKNSSSSEGLETEDILLDNEFATNDMPSSIDENVVSESEEVSAPVEVLPRKPINVWKLCAFIFLFLLFSALGAGYYYISNIDWNQHKDKIAAEFSNLTGKRIVFEGPVHLTFWPAPKLQAENIKIYNPGEDLDEPLAQVKSLVADLTLKSVLQGDFDVKMMSLVEPNIRLELMEDNRLNWDTSLTDSQRANLENIQVTLDSVLVKNATIHWIDDIRKRNYTINNINAEVIAQSIFGPYRIEGTYIKNENPEGFAFSIGKINSGLSTSVNAVINQPSTETFVRFDGSVLPQNNAINGNLIFESKKLMDFVNSNSDSFKLKPEYDYPLALTLELKSNKQKIEVTNFAAKYGSSAGAGNLLIPLTAGEYNTEKQKESFRPKIEFGFNFASLDMEPVSKFFHALWNKYKTGEANYTPNLDFDILADIKAVKAIYNNQAIKDFKISFDVIDNKITIRDFSAVLPGDAALSLSGDIYSDLGYLTFNLKPSFKTDEFRQTLNWLGITPKITKDTLLRRIDMKANVVGNFNKFGFTPLNLKIDNSVFAGEVGVINDKKLNLYISLDTNLFNVDDYFPDLVVNNPEKTWAENMNSRFQNMALSPDISAVLQLKANTVLYNSLPYNGLNMNATFQEGSLLLNSFNVDNVAGAKVNLSGIVKGFGKRADVKDLKFNLETKNLSEFVNKFALPIPNIDMKKFNNFAIQGVVTGFPDRMVTKSFVKLENINIDYDGTIISKDGEYVFIGLLEMKSPDFVKMLNDFNFAYAPRTYVLGGFGMQTSISGNLKKFSAPDLKFNIGSNTFSGKVSYDYTSKRPSINANLRIDRFELDKFFYNNAKVKNTQNVSFKPQMAMNKVDFLERPHFDEEKFNFDFLNSFDLEGKFSVSRLSYKDWNFDYSSFGITLKKNVIKLSDFKADLDEGRIQTQFELLLHLDNPLIKGSLELSDIKIKDKYFSGMRYGLSDGILSLSSNFVSSARSFADIYENLDAEGKFDIQNAVMKGWNIADIHKDLLERKTSEGLNAFVKSKFISGEEIFSNVQGNFLIENQQFSATQSAWKGEGFSSIADINASLNNWEGNFIFDIDFMSPDYLPNFSVIYSGALNAPELNVDVEKLAIMYNQRQREIQEQEAAKKAAQEEMLRKKLSNSLLKTKGLESELVNVVRPNLMLNKQKATLPDVLNVYDNLEKRIDKIESDLSEAMLVSQNPEITEEMIADVDNQNTENARYIENIKEEIAKVNLDNLRNMTEQKQEVVLMQSKNADVFMEKYKPQKQELEKRLSLIVTNYSLDTDKDFNRLDANFQGLVTALNNMVKKIEEDYQNLDKNDAFALDKFLREVSALENDIKKYVDDIKSAYEQLFVYANERVKIAEEAYLKKKREEEIKKKLEENTGSISVKGTGVSKTVVRDLEDIEKSEEAVDNNETKILDFSKPKSDAPIIKKANSPVSRVKKTTSNLIKKTDGEISKATGVIIRK